MIRRLRFIAAYLYYRWKYRHNVIDAFGRQLDTKLKAMDPEYQRAVRELGVI